MEDFWMGTRTTITLPAGRTKRLHGIPTSYRENVAAQDGVLPTFAIHYNGKVFLANDIEIRGRPTRLVHDYQSPLKSPQHTAADGRVVFGTCASTYWETTGMVTINVDEAFAEPQDVTDDEPVAVE
jgi:hypothetical protein